MLEFLCIPIFLALLTWLIRFLVQRRNRNLVYSLLPGPKHQHPLFGDLNLLVGRSRTDGPDFHILLLQSLLGLSQAFRKEGLCRVWFGYDPHVFLYSADTFESVVTSQTTITKAPAYGLLHCWLGTGLLTSTGTKWRKRRKLLTPTFHYTILTNFISIFDNHSKIFVKKLNTLTDKDWVDIHPLVFLCSLDVICETAMGIKIGAQEAEFCEYAKAITEFGEILMKRMTKPWLQNDFIFSFTSDGIKLKKILHILHNFTSKVIRERKEELTRKYQTRNIEEKASEDEDNFGRKNKKPFLDLLLETQLKEKSLNDEDICEEVDTFMFEGHDTVSVGISWTMYHLGHHPEIQENIYEELQQILGDDEERPITSKDLSEMKYLECVIKESQRITPSVPTISRLATEDITIKGYTIPRGTTVALFIYSLHRDPNVFPDPELFNPDRFLPENSIGRHPFAYIPFSAGPRNCIGQKFAMMEMKILLCNVLRNFILKSLDPPSSIKCSDLLVLRPENKLRIKFTKRN